MTQNIAVIAANGKSGQLIVREAVDRGLDVALLCAGEQNRRPARHHQGSVRPDRSRSRRIRCGRRRVRRMDAGNPPAALHVVEASRGRPLRCRRATDRGWRCR